MSDSGSDSDSRLRENEVDDVTSAQLDDMSDEEGNESQYQQQDGDIDDERDHEGGDNDGSVESEEFLLAKPINPLGGDGVKTEEHHDSWQFGLGMVAEVADIATHQIQAATAAAGRVLPIKNLYRKKTFSISFNSRKNIPFEFLTNASGAVVVSHVSKSIDERLHRGVVVVGVNDSVVEVSENASEELEKLLDNASLPFTVIFEEYEEEDELAPADYEEDSLDEEEHAGKSYASTSSNSSDRDARDREDRHHPTSHHDIAATASSSASLLTSSIFSLTSRMRNFVLPSTQQEPPAAVGVAKVHSGGTGQGKSSYDSNNDDEGDDDTDDDLPHKTFELILSTRSPPFVFDLHADGSSIVVVKLVGDRRSMDPRLQEGCVVRLINSTPVECRSRQEFDAMLMAVEELPLRMVLEHAPALYRHQDALSLFTSASADQAIHVFTVTPHLHEVHSSRSGKPAIPRYDDVYQTSRRALEVLQAFRAQGVAVSLVSVETVLLANNCSAYSGTLYQPSSNALSGLTALSSSAELLRAVRVWFRFSDAQEVVVDNPSEHLGALEVTRSGQEGSWIVMRCLDAQSVWVDAGLVIGRPYLVTHVNGMDISASGYRSVSNRIRGDGTWEGSVLPLFDAEEIKFTIV